MAHSSKCRPLRLGSNLLPQLSTSGQSPWLWGAVLPIWLLLVGLIARSLILLLFKNLSFLQRASLLIFLGWVSLVWLQGIYTATLLLVKKRGKQRSLGPSFNQTPAVALLYTTMNDFSEKAALSCVHQEYPDFHVFLLDDSSELCKKTLVDEFQRRFPKKSTVIRRPSRNHFKAGNLNHALGIIACNYGFFAVCDADGVLPPDFLRKTLAYFVDKTVGFVQARQCPILSSSASGFGFDLLAAGEIYWEQVFSRAARTGFVMFHGHGGILRTKVWQESGGFPQLVSEDLAFSTRIRQLGYVGVIADDIVCLEDFPPSRSAFCKRQLKYVRGTCEHLKRDMVPFLCSLRVPWFEKADRLLSSLTMVSAPLLVIFLIDFLFFLPLAFPPESGVHIRSTAKRFPNIRPAFVGKRGFSIDF